MALLRRITLIIMGIATVAAGVVAPAIPASASGVAAPTLVSPANDTTTPLKDVVLSWNPVAGASLYQVEISQNADFTNNVVTLPGQGQTVATAFEVPVSLPHSTYYWHVRAQVGETWGSYSAPWQFLRQWEAAITVVHSPATADPTLSWAPVPHASLYRVMYSPTPITLDVITNASSACTTNSTSLTPFVQDIPSAPLPCVTGLTDGTSYYWGVAAYDDSTDGVVPAPNSPSNGAGCKQMPECDALMATGGPFVFKHQTGGTTGGSIAPLTGLTTSTHSSSSTATPCDTTTPCPMTPTYSWTPVNGANFYDITVSRDADQTNVYRTYSTEWPSLTPADSYLDAQPGKPYYWSVTAGVCNSSGVVVSCTGETPVAQTCAAPSTATDAAPSISSVSVSPAGPSGSQSMNGGADGTVTLGTADVKPGACVVASSGAITSTPTIGASTVTFSYNAPVSGGAVTFKIINPDGGASTDSQAITVVSSVTITAVSAVSTFGKRSGPIHQLTPADGATEHGRAFTFSWDDYLTNGSQGTYEPKNYELQVSKDSSFTAPVLDVKTIDMTRYTDRSGSLSNGHYYWRVGATDESGNQLSWSTARQVAVNATGPQAKITSKDGIGILHPIHIKLSEVVHGVNGRTVKIVPDGKPVSAALPGSVRLGASPKLYLFVPRHPYATGGLYDLWVSPSLVDDNGNAAEVSGGPVRIATVAKNGSRGWSYSNGWTRFRASGALSGSYVSAHSGRSAHLSVAGDVVKLYACKGPSMGSIRISIDGHSQTVSERQSFTRCGVQIWHRALPAGESKLTLSVAGGTANLDEVAVS